MAASSSIPPPLGEGGRAERDRVGARSALSYRSRFAWAPTRPPSASTLPLRGRDWSLLLKPSTIWPNAKLQTVKTTVSSTELALRSDQGEQSALRIQALQDPAAAGHFLRSEGDLAASVLHA